MQKLHLVGFTTDQKGLILSARRGARSGSFQLPLDDAIVEAVEELRARQAEEEAEIEEAEGSRVPRVESALPVREIQARLRQGRTVRDVAKAAGVEPGWVERFAAPVFAEQAQVIRKVRSMALRRARLGPSSHVIGDAVRRNLAERGVALTPEEFSDAWSTRQLADGRWTVRFSFRHRNRDQVLRFDFDAGTGAVAAADRASGQLGYVAPAPTASSQTPERPRPVKAGGEVRPTAKRATVTTGFRPEAESTKAVSRPAKERERATTAMRKAVAKRAVEAGRAVTRKAKEKQEAAVRRERAAKVEEARKRRERAAAEKAKAAAARKRAAAAKRAAEERARRKATQQAAAQAKRAEAALVAAEKAKAAERAAAKKVVTKKVPAKKVVTKKVPAKKVPAKKARAGKKAPAKKARAGKTTATSTRAAKALPSRAPMAVAPAAPAPIVVQDERSVPPRPAPVAPSTAPAADVYGPTAVRALFRIGLVEPVGDQPLPAARQRDDLDGYAVRPRDRLAPAPDNGVAPPRPLDRPRRTRPLRAT